MAGIQYRRPSEITSNARPTRGRARPQQAEEMYDDEKPAGYIHLNMHLSNGMSRQIGKGIALLESNQLMNMIIEECLVNGTDINDLLDDGVFSLTINSGTSTIPEDVGFGSRHSAEPKEETPVKPKRGTRAKATPAE